MINGRVGEFLAWQNAPSRLYYDAIFARTVERVFDLPTVDVFDDAPVMRQVLGLAGQSNHLPPPLLQDSPQHGVSHDALHANDCINFLRKIGLLEQYTTLHLPTVEPVVEVILGGFFDYASVRELPIGDLEKQELLRRMIAEAAAAGVTLADAVQIRRRLIENVEHARLHRAS